MNIRFEKLTSPEADGGVQLPGSHSEYAGAHSLANSIQLAAVNFISGEHMEEAATSARQRRTNSVSSPASVSSLLPVNLASAKPARPFIPEAELQPVHPLDSRPYLLQLALDVVAVVVCIVFLCAAAVSIPLAVFLMLFAAF